MNHRLAIAEAFECTHRAEQQEQRADEARQRLSWRDAQPIQRQCYQTACNLYTVALEKFLQVGKDQLAPPEMKAFCHTKAMEFLERAESVKSKEGQLLCDVAYAPTFVGFSLDAVVFERPAEPPLAPGSDFHAEVALQPGNYCCVFRNTDGAALAGIDALCGWAVPGAVKCCTSLPASAAWVSRIDLARPATVQLQVKPDAWFRKLPLSITIQRLVQAQQDTQMPITEARQQDLLFFDELEAVANAPVTHDFNALAAALSTPAPGVPQELHSRSITALGIPPKQRGPDPVVDKPSPLDEYFAAPVAAQSNGAEEEASITAHVLEAAAEAEAAAELEVEDLRQEAAEQLDELERSLAAIQVPATPLTDLSSRLEEALFPSAPSTDISQDDTTRHFGESDPHDASCATGIADQAALEQRLAALTSGSLTRGGSTANPEETPEFFSEDVDSVDPSAYDP
eukprot:TRINITY_DN3641_c0_g1_i1.p1 TRINITY_DN3641_c0_g1~~TRINITY_DN3641_c0_g1_i1.p1  ORF type:complete len:456 (-),score=80.48 TRINITY_DN3641_c0_g1_i1:102-1469(-)